MTKVVTGGGVDVVAPKLDVPSVLYLYVPGAAGLPGVAPGGASYELEALPFTRATADVGDDLLGGTAVVTNAPALTGVVVSLLTVVLVSFVAGDRLVALLPPSPPHAPSATAAIASVATTLATGGRFESMRNRTCPWPRFAHHLSPRGGIHLDLMSPLSEPWM
jgi:hypothetical protein